MRCVICRQQFDFAAGQTAVVLRHVAYGYDFAHPGRCDAAAMTVVFPEPGYACAAFAHHRDRSRVLAVLGPPAPQELHVVIEYRDGSRHVERIVRDPEWLEDPGAAEFPFGRAESLELVA